MKYTELIESCKKAIEKNYCGGCTALEQIDFKGNSNCPYRMPSAQESIKQIKLNLRNGDKR